MAMAFVSGFLLLAFEAETCPLRQMEANYHRDVAVSQLMNRQALTRMAFNREGSRHALNQWLRTSRQMLPDAELKSGGSEHNTQLQWQGRSHCHRVAKVSNGP